MHGTHPDNTLAPIAPSGGDYLPMRPLRAVPSCLRFYRLAMVPDLVQLRSAVLARQLPLRPPSMGRAVGFQAFLPPEALPSRTAASMLLEVDGLVGLRVMALERKVPASARKRALAERLSEFVRVAGREPLGREALVLETEVMARLGRHAPIEETDALLILDPARRRLAVEARTPQAADRLVTTVRAMLGSFPCEPVQLDRVSEALTGWLATGAPPRPFRFGSRVTLRDEERQAASMRNHDLASVEVHAHLRAGKLVREVEMVHEPAFAVVVREDATFAGLRALQPDDRQAPTSLEHAAAIARRLWPAILDGASRLFRAAATMETAPSPLARPRLEYAT